MLSQTCIRTSVRPGQCKTSHTKPVGALRHTPFVPLTVRVVAGSSCNSSQQRCYVVAFAKKGGKKGGDDSKADNKSDSKAGAAGAQDLETIAKQTNKECEDRMKKSQDAVSNNFATIRTGRANPMILDKVQVEYFGSMSPIKNLASISVPDASTLRIAPFDKASMKDIERAIQEADLGINPNNDGEAIRINFPPMTEERRKELAKSIAKMGEEGKVAIRNVRKDILKKYVEKNDFPKDSKKNLEDQIQKTTDLYIKKVEDMVKGKTEEIMKI